MESDVGSRGVTFQAISDLAIAATTAEPVSGLTHGFYLYPARFSPRFVRAAIRAFTKPGDLVLDPFVGGGTTLVEAAAEGRPSVGCDINELAVFVSQVKTEMYTDEDLWAVVKWVESLRHSTNLRVQLDGVEEQRRGDHFRNASTRHTWHIRKFLEMAVSTTGSLASRRQEKLARCILLRLGRWALDCRMRIPRASEIRAKADEVAAEVTRGAREFSSSVRLAGDASGQITSALRPLCLHSSAIDLGRNEDVVQMPRPRLVVCSPPYVGTHVLYHRWQVGGRRETPAPYWIAGCTDGKGASFYTMGGRSKAGQQQYFVQIYQAFASLAGLVSPETTIVQLVSFSTPTTQLPRYLRSMERAGFTERFLMRGGLVASDGRLWRAIPNRRWYTHRSQTEEVRQEVVLFHSLS